MRIRLASSNTCSKRLNISPAWPRSGPLARKGLSNRKPLDAGTGEDSRGFVSRPEGNPVSFYDAAGSGEPCPAFRLRSIVATNANDDLHAVRQARAGLQMRALLLYLHGSVRGAPLRGWSLLLSGVRRGLRRQHRQPA